MMITFQKMGMCHYEEAKAAWTRCARHAKRESKHQIGS